MVINLEGGRSSFHNESQAKQHQKQYGGTVVKLMGQMPEPKKPKMMAPALAYFCGQHQVSSNLYSSEMQARNELRELFVSWPAVPNKDGFYEVME
jgi:hypothetical protein